MLLDPTPRSVSVRARRPSHCRCRCREAAEKAALAAAQNAEQDVAVKDEEFAEKQRVKDQEFAEKQRRARQEFEEMQQREKRQHQAQYRKVEEDRDNLKAESEMTQVTHTISQVIALRDPAGARYDLKSVKEEGAGGVTWS